MKIVLNKIRALGGDVKTLLVALKSPSQKAIYSTAAAILATAITVGEFNSRKYGNTSLFNHLITEYYKTENLVHYPSSQYISESIQFSKSIVYSHFDIVSGDSMSVKLRNDGSLSLRLNFDDGIIDRQNIYAPQIRKISGLTETYDLLRETYGSNAYSEDVFLSAYAKHYDVDKQFIADASFGMTYFHELGHIIAYEGSLEARRKSVAQGFAPTDEIMNEYVAERFGGELFLYKLAKDSVSEADFIKKARAAVDLQSLLRMNTVTNYFYYDPHASCVLAARELIDTVYRSVFGIDYALKHFHPDIAKKNINEHMAQWKDAVYLPGDDSYEFDPDDVTGAYELAFIDKVNKANKDFDKWNDARFTWIADSVKAEAKIYSVQSDSIQSRVAQFRNFNLDKEIKKAEAYEIKP